MRSNSFDFLSFPFCHAVMTSNARRRREWNGIKVSAIKANKCEKILELEDRCSFQYESARRKYRSREKVTSPTYTQAKGWSKHGVQCQGIAAVFHILAAAAAIKDTNSAYTTVTMMKRILAVLAFLASASAFVQPGASAGEFVELKSFFCICGRCLPRPPLRRA